MKIQTITSAPRANSRSGGVLAKWTIVQTNAATGKINKNIGTAIGGKTNLSITPELKPNQ